MLFPEYRARRMRQNEAFRRMVRETELSVKDLILPLLAVEGRDVQNPIPSMPGHCQMSVEHLVAKVREAAEAHRRLEAGEHFGAHVRRGRL